MYPFERFTERAKAVLTLAQQEAEAAQHSYIGTEHLLLALLRQSDGIAARVLANLGVELDRVREVISAVLSSQQQPAEHIVPTSRVKRAVEISFDEAQRMGHTYVGTEHLLLGLIIEGEGVAARVLGDMGATLERVRAEIDRVLETGAIEPSGPQTRAATAPRSTPSNSPALRELLRRAQLRAAKAGSPTVGLDHLLLEAAAGSAGTEALARLLDLRRTAALKDQAIAAQDFETAAGHRAEEKQALAALEQAVTAWREDLEPPRPAAGSN